MAARLFLDHESWFNVPIYIRTGKKLKKKHTSIVIEFKKFEFQDNTDEPNLLIIELYPEEKFSIKLVNKNLVGESFYRGITTSDYIGCEGDDCLPEHSVLLMEVLHENKIDFLCFPEILAAWKFTEEIVDFLKAEEIIPHSYKDESAGPPEHLKIPENDGFKWHEL
jgi:glucose-6-phosphate 1-dehydrogenase